MARLWRVVPLVLLASGCALVPGMRVNDRELVSQPRGEDGAIPQVELVSITPAVVRAQLEAAQARPGPPADPLTDQARSYEYRVAPHDVLSVIVWDHPELTIPAGEFRAAEAAGHPVTAAGTMFYPHVGVIQVAGKTLSEIRQLLTERLARVVEKPQLDVKVAAFRGYRVHVTGQVTAPATVPITDVPLRAVDAIAAARGPTPEADLSRVLLSRGGKLHTLDLQAMNERGQVGNNWMLQDGDILHVPDRGQNVVYVMGEVRRPAARPMARGRMSLAEAINLAEGFDPDTSNPGAVYVFRGPYERPAMFKLDAHSPDAMLLAVQFQLQPQDVVFVSATPLSQWNRVVRQLLPTIQSLWYSASATNSVLTVGRTLVPVPVETTP
jgi:polysaccharide export outer membrane protein